MRRTLCWPVTVVALAMLAGCYGGSGHGGGALGTGGAAGTSSSGAGGSGASTSGGRGGVSSGGVSSGGVSASGASAGGSAASSGTAGAQSAGSGGGSSVPVLHGGACVTPEEPVPPACVGGAAVQYYCDTAATSQPIMAICSVYANSQCDAASGCAPGWHLCTGTEYLDRGGRDVPPPDSVIYAWIAACVRDGSGSLYHDGICAVCGSESGDPPAKIYDCAGTDLGPGMIDDSIGVVTDTSCHRVGVNQADKNGFWAIDWASSISAQALCCKGP